MNSKIRQLIAATTLVAVGSMSLPVMASAQDTAQVTITKPVVQDVAQQTTFVPIRAALNAVGVTVDWVYKNGQKVVLTYGGQSVDVSVDAANGVLRFQGGAYAYNNIKGSLHVAFNFYQSIFNNANVAYNYNTGGIIVNAIDASKVISLKGGTVSQQQNSQPAQPNYTYYESGQATWYGSGAHGNYTASGEVFNMYDYTAAHKYLPFGTKVRVTDTQSGRSVIVRINDRGPFGAGRVIDLSYQAANDLGIISKGVAPCKLEIVK